MDMAAKYRDIIGKYCHLMEEVKRRADIILETYRVSVFDPRTLAELSYLQLGCICELIALGCLVAHGDLKEVQSKKMRKAYAADQIINRLERLHPDFYPRPGEHAILDNGQFVRVQQIP